MSKLLTILPSSSIDKNCWDNCIAKNKHGLIYAQTALLDYFVENWHGIVIGNYEAVMPLTWKRKWGIKYLYKEVFIQQLGIIGNYQGLEDEILKKVHQFCSYGSILFNHDNHIPHIHTQRRLNLILPLNNPYEYLYKNYQASLKRNIQKATSLQLRYENAHITDFIYAYQHTPIAIHQIIPTASLQKLIALYKSENTRQKCVLKKVINRQGELLSVGFFLKDDKRLYNICPLNLPLGKTDCAMPFLIDAVIKEFSNSTLIFDFEGSNIPSIKKFYQKFAPLEEYYALYQYNHLPFPLNLIKKGGF